MKPKFPFDFLIVLAFWLFFFGIIFWTVPQKWKACTILYDNIPAQIACFW